MTATGIRPERTGDPAEVRDLVRSNGRDDGDNASPHRFDGLVADGLVERCADGRLRLPR